MPEDVGGGAALLPAPLLDPHQHRLHPVAHVRPLRGHGGALHDPADQGGPKWSEKDNHYQIVRVKLHFTIVLVAGHSFCHQFHLVIKNCLQNIRFN